MRRLAKEAETETLRKGCLKAADDYELLAKQRESDEGKTEDQP